MTITTELPDQKIKIHKEENGIGRNITFITADPEEFIEPFISKNDIAVVPSKRQQNFTIPEDKQLVGIGLDYNHSGFRSPFMVLPKDMSKLNNKLDRIGRYRFFGIPHMIYSLLTSVRFAHLSLWKKKNG